MSSTSPIIIPQWGIGTPIIVSGSSIIGQNPTPVVTGTTVIVPTGWGTPIIVPSRAPSGASSSPNQQPEVVPGSQDPEKQPGETSSDTQGVGQGGGGPIIQIPEDPQSSSQLPGGATGSLHGLSHRGGPVYIPSGFSNSLQNLDQPAEEAPQPPDQGGPPIILPGCACSQSPNSSRNIFIVVPGCPQHQNIDWQRPTIIAQPSEIVAPSTSINAGICICIPLNTLGLQQLYPSSQEGGVTDTTIDIIAIHSLGGDSLSTWTDRSSGKLWLRDLLPDYLLGKGINTRITVFGYDTSIFVQPSEGTRTLQILAEQFLDLLSRRSGQIRDNGRYRPIIFVCHSLGGLIIKQALSLVYSNQSQYPGVRESTKGVIFMSTPHGSDLTAWNRVLGNISTGIGLDWSKTARNALLSWSSAFMDLAARFSEKVMDIDITSFSESKELNGVIVVPGELSQLTQGHNSSTVLNANHRTICQFGTATTPVATAVLADIAKTAMAIAIPLAEK